MPRYPRRRTPEIEVQARELATQGHGWAEIGRRLGVNSTTARSWIDDNFAALRRARNLRRHREERATRRVLGEPHGNAAAIRARTQAHRDALRLLDAVPPDTRDLTAQMCGDPLPGRSALAQRQSQPEGAPHV